MLHHIQFVPFLVGVLVGLFLLFYYDTPAVVVYEYPHPQNAETRIYKDKNGICYNYTSKEVSCDANEATLKQYPLQ
jgi:hypothetical protein